MEFEHFLRIKIAVDVSCTRNLNNVTAGQANVCVGKIAVGPK